MEEPHLILDAEVPLPSDGTRIHIYPDILNNLSGFECIEPMVVSIGPYHEHFLRLGAFVHIKKRFVYKLVSETKGILKTLNDTLSKRVNELRAYYDKDSCVCYKSDDHFTSIMAEDGCFILSFIDHFLSHPSYIETCDLCCFHSNWIRHIQVDLFLLSNQIPYQVLIEVINLLPDPPTWEFKINRFIDTNILVTHISNGSSNCENYDPIPTTTTHLLEVLQKRITKRNQWSQQVHDILTSSFTASELYRNQWIRFRPKTSGSFACISFVNNWFFSYLEIPPIIMNIHTKRLLVNLIGQEMYVGAKWVTMYVCLLHSLIKHSNDVKVLLKAGVLKNLLCTDEQVVDMFNELGMDHLPDSFKTEFVISQINGNLKIKSD